MDRNTKKENEHVDVKKTFKGLLLELGGASSLFPNIGEFVDVVNYLECARLEYLSDHFKYATYRKLILDAGSKMLLIENSFKNE